MASEDAMIAELREQTKWLRLLGLQALRPLLDESLRTEKHRAAFESSNGERSVRDVARLAGMSTATVSRLWGEWIAAGICVESIKAKGRAQHLASLSSLGLSTPLAKSDADDVDGSAST